MKSNNICQTGYIYILLLLIFSVSACSKMNDLHNKYLQNGEMIYVGKPDSVVAFAGKERVKLRYWVTDPKAVKMVIYWSSRTDSMVIDIPAHLAKDSLEVIIPNLPEKSYSFELVTMNKNNSDRSVPKDIIGHSYGDVFQSIIGSRTTKDASKFPEGIFINWLNAPEKSIGCELIYVDTLGNSVKRFVPDSVTETTITDAAGGIKYHTLFLPEVSAFDTFYTDLEEVPIVIQTERIMDKSLFMRWNPSGIPYSDLASAYSIEKMWDDNLNTFYLTKTPGGFPFSFTFDMGKEVKLKRFIAWQRQTASTLFIQQNVKSFELWGSSTPNVTADTASWVKLGEYEVIKPSGLPWGTNSSEDILAGVDGAHFDIVPNIPVRYLRIIVTDNWNGVYTYMTFGEMAFYEDLQ